MIAPIAFAETSSTELASQNQLFQQAEFFLFLANSIELNNKLTTPIDIVDMEYLEKVKTVSEINTSRSEKSKAELLMEERKRSFEHVLV